MHGRTAACGTDSQPNDQVLTPTRSGHDISSAIHCPRPPAGARSATRTPRTRDPGWTSAHLPAATRPESCLTADPVALIRVRSSGAQPAVRAQDRRDLHRGPGRHLLLQRDREVEHIGRGARRHPARVGHQRVEPATAPVADPPVDRCPRDAHRRPRTGPHAHARRASRTSWPRCLVDNFGSAASRISEYRNNPTARARSARTCSCLSWPTAMSTSSRSLWGTHTSREGC